MIQIGKTIKHQLRQNSRNKGEIEMKFEYQILKEKEFDSFKELGEQGWELCAIDNQAAAGIFSSNVYYFKRQLTSCIGTVSEGEKK
jgi:hypothetical protein